MSGERRPITVEGKKKLEAELQRLIHKDRPQIVQAIEEARAHGDLSENADYHAAKERQGYIEARIAEINGKLAAALVVDISSIKSDKITFGAHVRLFEEEEGKEIFYQIVGEDEADISKGKLSVASPLAKKLIGKKTGDVFDLKTPKGQKEFEVLDFRFGAGFSNK